MWIAIIVTISYLLSQNCLGLNLIDLPISRESDMSNSKESIQRRNAKSEETFKQLTPKNWRFRQTDDGGQQPHQEKNPEKDTIEKEKDANLKSKITTLIEQTIYDTDMKIKSIDSFKMPVSRPYQIGFVLSLVKKAREVINELFNVATKHRDSWLALEQLKIFELIVHTNVDTTNLVRQLVEIHIEHMNATNIIKKRAVFK